MATNRAYVRHPHRSRLTADQVMAFWLGSGPRYDPFPFASEAEKAALWAKLREQVMRQCPRGPGRRLMHQRPIRRYPLSLQISQR
jgi:hypothetical protein